MHAPRRFQQTRAKQTHDALLRAAAEVFAERGFEATQTPDIAAAAGVSTGAFYRHFDDKRQAFVEMLEGHLARGRAEISALLTPDRFVGVDARDAMDLVIEVLFDRVKRDAKLNRVYYAMSLTDPDVSAMRARAEAEDRVPLAQLIGSLVPRDRVPDPRAAALVAQIAALEVAAERAGLRPRKGPRLDDRAVRHTLREMFHRYLFGSDAPTKSKKRRARVG